MKKFLSILLVMTQILVFNTHDFQLYADEPGTKDQDAMPKDMGFVSFDAASASQVDLYTGQAGLSIPLFVPPGRKGLTPQVALSYSSGGGNGWCGKGWNLSFGDIERSTKRGVPAYTDDDTFVLNFGASSELVYDEEEEVYYPVHEALFMKIERDTTNNKWIVTDKSGTVYTFGASDNSRQKRDANSTFAWYLDKVEDTNGNYMEFTYQFDGNQIYPQYIDYNGHTGTTNVSPTHHITFTLETRDDVRFGYNANYRITTAKRLATITVKVTNASTSTEDIARVYELDYTASPSTGQSLLTSITEKGVGGVRPSDAPNAIEFEYTELDKAFNSVEEMTNVSDFGDSNLKYLSYGTSVSGASVSKMMLTDINRDGIPDRVAKKNASDTYLHVQLGRRDGTGYEDATTAWSGFAVTSGQDQVNLLSASESDYDVRYQLSDITGDGLPDRYYHYDALGENWRVQRSNGAGFESVETWAVEDYSHTDYRFIIDKNSAYPNEQNTDFTDINGDGYPDRIMQLTQGGSTWTVQFGTGSGFTNGSWPGVETFGGNWCWSRPSSATDGSWRTVRHMLADINGDGLPDRIVQRDGATSSWEVQYNTGTGFASVENWAINRNGSNEYAYPTNSDTSAHQICMLMDINADGLPDRVWQSSADTTYSVQLNTGSSFGTTTSWTAVDNSTSNYAYLGYSDTSSRGRMGLYDINGDGLVERVMSDGGTTYSIQKQKGEFPDLLKTVVNGHGGQTGFTYRPSTRYDNTGDDGIPDLGFPVQTVSSITMTDALGNEFTTTYDYKGGKFDYAAREFRGFHKVTATDPAGTETTSYYYQDDDKQGKLYQKEICDSDGHIYSRTKTTWGTRTPHEGVSFVCVDHEDEYTFDGLHDESEADYRRRRTSFDYDAYGNLTETVEEGEYYDPNEDNRSDVTGDGRTTIHEYTYNTNDWIMNTLAHTKLQDADNTTVAEKWFYYDNSTSYNASPTKGNLTKEEDWCDTGTNPTTEMTYDEFGNIHTIEDARGNVTTNSYDDDYYQFLEVVTNAAGKTQQFTYDALLAKITATTDANGVTTTTEYDPFGRPKKIIEPGDTTDHPTKQFFYRSYLDASHLERVQVDLLEASGTTNVLTSYSFVDGLGRKIQTRVESATAGTQVVADMVELNDRGLVSAQYIPYFEDTATEYTGAQTTKPKSTFTYDALGRKVRSTLPDGSYSATEYGIWAVTGKTNDAADENEQKTTRLMDAYGRVIEVQEYNGANQYCTAYEYDSRDNLVQVEDHYGNITTITYDSLGRKIELNDSDTGVTTYTYDANGNLYSQADANGNTITFTYDELNRVTLKDYSDANTADVSYYYGDDDEEYNIGRLVSIDDGTTACSFTYDERGRVLTESQGALTYTYAYDTMGRKTDITYPNGLHIAYTFDAGGAIDKVGVYSGEDLIEGFFVSHVEYNASGMMTKVEYGNNVISSYTYDEDTLRLTQLITRDAEEAVIQNLNYEFDNNGNVEAIIDNVNTGSQFFEYDGLNRLTESRGVYGIIDYAYDPLGNMVTKGDLSMVYGQGAAGPHQVTSSSDGREFAYDANGNMTLRGPDVMEYDADNRLTEVNTYKGEADTREYHFTQGWNVVSFPSLPENKTIAEVLAGYELGVDYDQVSVYVPETGEWRHLVNDAEFSDLSEFAYGEVYQIHVLNASGMDVTIDGRLSSKPVHHELHGGNNYFGILKNENVAVEDVLGTAYYNEIEVFNDTTGAWEEFTGTEFAPDKAYNVVVPEEASNTKNYVLDHGWQPISFPCLPANKTISNVLSTLTFGTDYDQISYYDTYRQSWQHYVNDAEFSDFDEVAHRTEYQIYVTNPQGVSFTVSGDVDLGQIVLDCGELELADTATYTYGPDGERIGKTVGGETVTYCGAGYEVRDNSPVCFIFLGDFRIAECKNTGVFFLHTDHLQSTNVITDLSGEQAHLYEYEPFGETVRDEGDADAATAYKYTGQEEDEAVGLYYYHARYYDASLGRFIQADSIVQSPYDPQTLNRYAYCRNNPVKFVDPSGNSFWGAVLGAIGAIIAIALAPFTAGMSLWACVGMGAMYGAIGGAIGGMIGGGIDAAIAGGSIGKGMLTGAITGAIGGAISGALAGAGNYLALAKAGPTNAAVNSGSVTTEEAAQQAATESITQSAQTGTELATRTVDASTKTSTIVENQIAQSTTKGSLDVAKQSFGESIKSWGKDVAFGKNMTGKVLNEFTSHVNLVEAITNPANVGISGAWNVTKAYGEFAFNTGLNFIGPYGKAAKGTSYAIKYKASLSMSIKFNKSVGSPWRVLRNFERFGKAADYIDTGGKILDGVTKSL